MIQTSNALRTIPRAKPQKANGKQRVTITLPPDLLDRLRNAVYWTPHLTLAGFIEAAVGGRLDELEKQNGEPFPTRAEELKGGRPRRNGVVNT